MRRNLYLLLVCVFLVSLHGQESEGEGARRNESDAETSFQEGVDFFLHDFFDLALERFHTAVRLNPDVSAAWANLGMTYIALGDSAQAEATYLEGLRRFPQDEQLEENLRVLRRLEEIKGLEEKKRTARAAQTHQAMETLMGVHRTQYETLASLLQGGSMKDALASLLDLHEQQKKLQQYLLHHYDTQMQGESDDLKEDTPNNDVFLLPAPQLSGPVSLEEAITQRRSIRDFSQEPVAWNFLSQVLWAMDGDTRNPVKRKRNRWRSSPSAGALFPLEIFVCHRDGLYQYIPEGHKLSLHQAGDMRHIVWQHGLQQECLYRADAILIITAVYRRCSHKYGERAERYVKLEAGHVAQNGLLQASALGLGATPIGAFDDRALHEALHLQQGYAVLYLIPMGWPQQDH